MGVAEERCLHRRADPATSHRGHRSTTEERGDIEVDAVHEPAVKGLAEHAPTALQEDAGDFAATKFTQHATEGFSAKDQRAGAVHIGKNAGVPGQNTTARDDDPPWLARPGGVAHGQAGVVGAEGLCADEDGIDLPAQPHGIGARRRVGQPLAFAGRARESAIEGHAGLGDDQGQSGDDPFVETGVQLTARAFQNARRDGEARGAEQVHATPGVGGIRIDRADDHASQTRANDRADARRRASVRGARFERDVERRPARVARIFQSAQRLDLRVRPARALMKAARHNAPTAHEDRADGGIRARVPNPPHRFAQSRAHEFVIVHGHGLNLARASLNPELRAVSLSLRDKQSLYHSLAQLVRSGIPFPSALDNLARTTRGGMRKVIGRLKVGVTSGQTVGEAFARQRPAVGEMEVGVITAVERAGRLEHGLAQLAEYFGALAQARTGILKKCAYPVFVLHLGVFVFGLKTLLGGGLGSFLRETCGLLGLLYGVAIVIALVVPLLRNAAARSALPDALLRWLPLVGGIRRALSTARFCATYEMQLNAGINVIDALQAAQRASQSGLIRATVARAIPEVRAGAQVGGLLAVGGVFPEPMIRSFCIGEQTGELDVELLRLAAEYRAEGLARIDTLAEWLPRLLYCAVVIYIGWGVVTWYQNYLQQAMKLLDG